MSGIITPPGPQGCCVISHADTHMRRLTGTTNGAGADMGAATE